MAMPDELSARLLRMFAEELDDQLRVANEHVLALEKTPADTEQLRSLFRVMHTLKGAARSADVGEAEKVCHRLEGLLAAARDQHRALTAVELDELFTGIDQLSVISSKLGGNTAEARPGEAPATQSSPSATTVAASPAGD